MNFEELKLMAIVSNDLIKRSNVIICLEGDGYSRIEETTKLFKEKWAPMVVISGGYSKPPFSIPARNLAKEIKRKGVPPQKIILEEKSQNTYEQAYEVLKIVKEKKWKRIILVASHFHQPRAYLTFLRAMKDLNFKIQIFNAPARKPSWLNKTSLNKNRLQLLEEEFKKIKKYTKKGHLVAIKEAIDYQKWKERKN